VLVYGDDRRSDAAGRHMQAKMTPRRRFPRRLTPPGSMLAMLSRQFRETRTEPLRQCESETIPYTKGRFAIIGDVQPTSKVEFWRKSNARERVQLIQQITMEAPDFLAIVGDLVFCGSSAANWTAFDTLATPLYDARVPVFPLLGNHDYGIVRHAALKHFFTRFPHLERCHWFSRTYGPLGLIFLDSNARRLPMAQWRRQVRWYKQELQRFEQRPDIRGVLVLLHHPPYTNSVLVSDDLAVQRAFVPPFMQAGKTLAMVSGHVHSYERFTRAAKTFLVTGGGGARSKVYTDWRRRHRDDCFNGPPLRGFHFLLLTPLSTRLEIEMQGLQQRHGGFETLDCLTIPF
jgi:Icc-related predicted phosphoesterase